MRSSDLFQFRINFETVNPYTFCNGPWTADRPITRFLPAQNNRTQKDEGVNLCLELDSNPRPLRWALFHITLLYIALLQPGIRTMLIFFNYSVFLRPPPILLKDFYGGWVQIMNWRGQREASISCFNASSHNLFGGDEETREDFRTSFRILKCLDRLYV
jgi:hypothetical protein